MLQLKNITKSYTTGDFKQAALNNVSLSFRKSEFVAILGQSGSGKTTFLNIIGGLDKYDRGDLVINDKSTKHFNDSEWDAYRNNSIGFIFQSYNLITHLSIMDNVEMGMTLSGISSTEKRKRALEVLEKVGLKEHIHKKPNQLSGGQMQRVAIARAIANDPDIILADEPTGALDTITSKQIMKLIKDISLDKLVIMVTHNSDLAEKYADRIVKFNDGEIVGDSNPYQISKAETDYFLKKTSMSLATALMLSGKNIATKKWRTTLTAFASSIGIIGIALILSLSSGFQVQINKYQRDTLSEFPIIIPQTAMDMDAEAMDKMHEEMKSNITGKRKYVNSNEIYLNDPSKNTVVHTNVFTDEYLNYINKIDPKILNSIGFTRITGMNLLRDIDGTITPVSVAIGINSDRGKTHRQSSTRMSSMSEAGLTTYPKALDGSSESYLEKNYDLLAGEYPKDEKGLVLVVDSQNRVNNSVLKSLGFDINKVDSLKFNDIVGTELKLISNDDYYIETEMGNFFPSTDNDIMYNSKNSLTLKIVGIIRIKKDVKIGVLGSGIVYSDDLVQKIIDSAYDSKIVIAQREADYNVITMEKIDEAAKTSLLSYLGGKSTPFMIYLYPTNFNSKNSVLAYLDKYNNGKAEKDKIIYTDLARTVSDMSSSIMNAITLVLIAFAAISLVVSLIMIGIITYISVLERTKEIGVLRALGARKKDITRVFNAETFIVGAFSGILGISIAYLLTIPTNIIIERMTDLPDVARLNPLHAILLAVISVTLTLVGGTIPAKMAAKKDPVEALRTE